ncbi:MAG TPA: hypothetical protein VM029_08620 [Opitutaceae bacterium]|nr:hypothetical protein [Opitutaceae bacterium]
MSVTRDNLRNHGPKWGFRFLQRAQRCPRWFLQGPLMLGIWVAVACMPTQRRYSREFLSLLHGRRAGWLDVWRHFSAYVEFLLLRLRAAGGEPVASALDPENAGEFRTLLSNGEPALFGTFHFGHSDLIGFMLPREKNRRIAMMRLRVANSEDTEMLERQFGEAVSFIWVNDPDNLLFAIKAAIERGDSLAMQCDRAEYSAKTEDFHFLGARRTFPFTIYHLAVLFRRPVIFCFGVPDDAGGTRIIAMPVFRAQPELRSAENLQRGRTHFQTVLERLESLVRQHPHLWFNFLPLNPTAPAPAKLPATAPVASGQN